MSRRPVITLTTDFGDAGYYPGAMRGVLISLCPDAALIDITHRVTPYAPLEGSFILEHACRTFPEGTVHLAVVDPGVGGLRKPIILRAQGYTFVGPDNGLFTPFLDGHEEIFRIHPSVARDEVSPTFHGRDLFAPAAARLARGEPAEELGERAHQAVRLHVPRPRRDGGWVIGQILYPDHFGNLITNIHRRDLESLSGELEVQIGTYRIPRVSKTYGEGALGESLALVGSSGHLEVAVAQGNAAAQLGVGRGERVRVRPQPPR